ncbi:MAG TPA: hypothetical protein VGR49_07395 [Actinomycetota bacterium]|jgi:hypothetical protein|nr:hypothetical protein [Actinomycetota bacterium]
MSGRRALAVGLFGGTAALLLLVAAYMNACVWRPVRPEFDSIELPAGWTVVDEDENEGGLLGDAGTGRSMGREYRVEGEPSRIVSSLSTSLVAQEFVITGGSACFIRASRNGFELEAQFIQAGYFVDCPEPGPFTVMIMLQDLEPR